MPTPVPKCLNVASHIEPRFGGIVTSLPPLRRELENQGRYGNPLAAFCLPDEKLPDTESSLGVSQFPHSHLAWFRDAASRRRFDGLVREASVIHVHGIWEGHCAAASRAARRARRPYLISAHGMLDPWALRQKKWKKSLYSQVFERRNLTLAACLRAMTVNEAEQYRRFGLSNPIAIIPNGVDIPANVTSGLFLERYPALRGKTIVLFLGRIHPKKGLLPLCLAWSAVQRQFADAHLVIAGPDCEDTVTALHRIIEEQGIQQSVTFAGLLTGLVKWSAYAAATIFTLPSYSEGFSVSVLEALGSGVPVLITEACYFPEVKTVNAGWTIAQVAEIQAALTTALATPLALIHKMGANGAALVAEKYSWPRIASQFADLYDWLLGGSTPTSCPIWAAPK